MLVKGFLSILSAAIFFGSVPVYGEMDKGGGTAPAQETSENLLWVSSVTGALNSDVKVKVYTTVTQSIIGAEFDLLFDQSKLQVKKLENGADAATAWSVADSIIISEANTSGKITFMHIFADSSTITDTTSALTQISAGENKELFVITFTVTADSVAEVSLTLENATLFSVSDTSVVEITPTLQSGTVTIVEATPGDADGNGKVDIFDLLGLLRVLAGSSEQTPGADADSNGKVDIFDLLALLKILSGR